MIVRLRSRDANEGSRRIASATLVSGPTATRWMSSRRCTRSTRKPTASLPSTSRVRSISMSAPSPLAPCTCDASRVCGTNGSALPAWTGTWSSATCATTRALRVVLSSDTLPFTVVIASSSA
jgi:hypothetical protein